MRQSGSGLIDTLVALLLLAFSLLGACTLLIRTLAASRAATIQTTAIDLAADLSEELAAEALRASVPSIPDEVVRAWRLRVSDALPTGIPPLDQFASFAPPVISLRWWDPAMHRPTELELLAASGTTP
jgi:hypothetical protein